MMCLENAGLGILVPTPPFATQGPTLAELQSTHLALHQPCS